MSQELLRKGLLEFIACSLNVIDGWTANVHRLWKREKTQARKKTTSKRRFPKGSGSSGYRHRAKHKNHVWSYDFVTDRTKEGEQLGLLVVVDDYTRECLAIEVARFFTVQDVFGVLQYLFAARVTPEHIRSDNSSEFVSKWA
ncbi:MAG: DDE-type integrase/transposase/recombinase [Mariniblastus sp.]